MIKLSTIYLLAIFLVCQNVHRVSASEEAKDQPDGATSLTKQCAEDFASTCSLKCSSGNYVLDINGCPTCKCASVTPKNIECTRPLCRMFCMNGFRRDENGCEICKCNEAPQECPLYKCKKTCENGYVKDSKGCRTCKCACPTIDCGKNCTNGVKLDEDGCQTCICQDDDITKITDGCAPSKCNRYCKYGFERDPSGCPLCSCNRCPLHTCRMFCMYGFKKNSDGCDVCECDWSPVSESISCSARIPCSGNRVCNLNLKLCELVGADRVNWFVYDFDVKTEFFHDPTFVHAFKSGLINNIATKYSLEPTQITVSSVEDNGMTSFQIMPFYVEDMDSFQKKMNQIDVDLNSHEFRTVLPAVAQAVDKNTNGRDGDSKWRGYLPKNPLYLAVILLALAALIFGGVFLIIFRQRVTYPGRSESKTPIYDTSYQPAPTEDDLYHAVRAPDGTAYVVVETDEVQGLNDKRALV